MRLLGQSDRDGGSRGQPGQQLVGGGVEFGGGHRGVDQPPVGRVGTGHLLAQQQHPLGAGHPGQARQQPGRARVRGETAGQERLPEQRVGVGDGEVGGEREIAAQARPPSRAPGRPPAGGSWRGVRSPGSRYAGYGGPDRPSAGVARSRWWPPSRHRSRSRRRRRSMPIARRVSSVAAAVRIADQVVGHRVVQRITPGRPIQRDSQDRVRRRECRTEPSRSAGVRLVHSPMHPPFPIGTVGHTVGDTITILYNLARKGRRGNLSVDTREGCGAPTYPQPGRRARRVPVAGRHPVRSAQRGRRAALAGAPVRGVRGLPARPAGGDPPARDRRSGVGAARQRRRGGGACAVGGAHRAA